MSLTVEHVMTADVVAVDEATSFHTVAERLIEHGISGLPVVDDAGRVVGVVSEADLLHKEEFKEHYYGEDYQPPLRSRLRHGLAGDGPVRKKAAGATAGELMTSPAIVTTPDSPIVLAARLMDSHGVSRLPVVDAEGRLVGILSRRDLVRVFVRDDEDIARQIQDEVVVRALSADPESVRVTVRDGVVTLSGELPKLSKVYSAVRLTQSLDGVVDVVDELSWKEDDVTVKVSVMWGNT